MIGCARSRFLRAIMGRILFDMRVQRIYFPKDFR
jgi:hypothetical protein